MTQKSCAVGMRNAKLENHLKWQPHVVSNNNNLIYKTKNLEVYNKNFGSHSAAFSLIFSRKQDHFLRYTQIFRNSLVGVQNFQLNGLHFRNLTIFGFCGNFPRKFKNVLPVFQNNFWLNGKYPRSPPASTNQRSSY